MNPDVEKGRSLPVIIDSNFLFIPLKFRVDIFEELQRLLEGRARCVVPSPVLEELKLIEGGAKPSLRRQAAFALSLAERCDRADESLRDGETVDDLIIRLAESWRCPVATNDAKLRRRLRERSIPVIYLRERSHLELDGTIR